VLAFVLTMAAASLVAWDLVLTALDEPAGRAFARAAFSVVSIATTTGFASGDFQLWGAFAPPFFLLLMLIGGCTGSTSGSIKIFRYQVVWREMMRQLERLVTPNLLRVATLEGRPVPPDVAPSVLVFLFLFFGAMMVGTLGLAATGLDLVTSLSGAITALANVGPGLGPVIGPAGTSAPHSDVAKWMLAAGMLLGRLEVFTVVVLLTPHFWRH
jgi:trk system potassium uptake protein TrkH